jgi:hypothetical protein
MDAQRKIENEIFVMENRPSVILLADATLTRFEFCPIGLPLPQDIEEKIVAMGLQVAGLVGIGRGGDPRTRLFVELDSDVVDRLARVYRDGVRARSTDWLERLWLLDEVVA